VRGGGGRGGRVVVVSSGWRLAGLVAGPGWLAWIRRPGSHC
jgi:hypothetical protein